MPNEAPLSMTADEVILLTERVKTTDLGTEDHRVIPYRFLERLGSVYLELVQDDRKVPGTVAVVLTEAEAWLSLDQVSSMDRTTDDALLGVKLKRKLFRLLIDLNSPKLLPTVDHDDPDRATVQNALLAFAVDRDRADYEDCPLKE